MEKYNMSIKGTKTEENLKDAFAGESQEIVDIYILRQRQM